MPVIEGNVISWASILDENAMEQAQKTASLPIIAGRLALMPDAHYGIGSTVGSVVPTEGAIIPSCVGVDIGCGMAAVKTNVWAKGLPDDADEMFRAIEEAVPAGMGKGHSFDTDWDRERRTRKVPSYNGSTDLSGKQINTITEQFGSLGGGNHFVEVCLDENDQVWVVLHSGSRGIGNQLASGHIKLATTLAKAADIKLPDPALAYFMQGTPEFDNYIADMLWAQSYALANREAMLDAVMKRFWSWVGTGGSRADEVERINCHHNYTEQEVHNGKSVWLTRKGAIRARRGDLGIIPGSMGAATYIVEGLGNPDSYNSCSHGAGRVMGRKEAERRLTDDSLIALMAGKSWNIDDVHQLRDESPEAYKSIDVVMEDQKDLVRIVHTLHQIINYKGVK